MGCSVVIGALVTEALSLAAVAVFRLFGAVVLNSRVPLEASDLESSTMAAVRWRGGAMVSGTRWKAWTGHWSCQWMLERDWTGAMPCSMAISELESWSRCTGVEQILRFPGRRHEAE